MKALKNILKTISALLMVIIIAVAVLLVVPLTENGSGTAVEGSGDWMAQLGDELMLNEVVLPGAHDAGTQYVQLGFFSKCQSSSIGGLLEDGCRYLDIRLGAEETDGGKRLILMHGFTKCRTGALANTPTLSLDLVLEDCYAFLDAHPTETVIFAVKQEHGDESVAEFEALLNGYIMEHPEYWILTDTLPSVGEARGKLVLMRRYDDEAQLGTDAGISLKWIDQPGSDDTALNIEENENPGYVLYVQDRYEYGAEDKWNAFSVGLNDSPLAEDEGGILLNFLSTKGTFEYGHPYSFAKKLDKQLLSADVLSDAGWIILDFSSAELAEHIYSANFS